MSEGGSVIHQTKVSLAATNHKSGLDGMTDPLGEIRSAISNFANDATLSGDGYVSIQGKLEQYNLVFSCLELAIMSASSSNEIMGSEVDNRFCGVVKEATFTELRDRATRLKSEYEEKKSTDSNLIAGINNAYLQLLIDIQQRDIERANTMLDKISSYISATSGLFEASKELDAALVTYTANLSAAIYDVESFRWPETSQEGYDTLKEAALKAARIKANLQLDDEGNLNWCLYSGYELNENQCRILMLLPFEFWEDLEKNAMVGCYNYMWDGVTNCAGNEEEAQKYFDMIEKFIQCAYVDGSESVYAKVPASHDGPAQTIEGDKYRKLFTESFKDFANYYTYVCEEPERADQLGQNRLRGSFLLDTIRAMDGVWVLDKETLPEFEMGAVWAKDSSGDVLPELLNVAMATQSYDGYDPDRDLIATRGIVTCSGNYTSSIDGLAFEMLASLGDDGGGTYAIAGLNTFITVLGLLPFPQTKIASAALSIGVNVVVSAQDIEDAKHENQVLDQSITMLSIQSVMQKTGMQGTLSIINGQIGVRCIGFDNGQNSNFYSNVNTHYGFNGNQAEIEAKILEIEESVTNNLRTGEPICDDHWKFLTGDNLTPVSEEKRYD